MPRAIVVEVKAAGGLGTRTIAVDDVVAMIRARGRTWVHTDRDEMPTFQPLSAFLDALPDPPFVRVARDAIVNMRAVAEINRRDSRSYSLRLADRAGTVVEASRSGAARVAPYFRPGS